MKLQELIKNVQQWSIDRDLDKADSKKQLLKLYEEFGELAAGIAKGNIDLVKDSVGDCVVVLIVLAQQESVEIKNLDDTDLAIGLISVCALGQVIGDLTELMWTDGQKSDVGYDVSYAIKTLETIALYQDLAFEDCLQQAWNEIKDRKGKLIDGVWVKEEDLKDDRMDKI